MISISHPIAQRRKHSDSGTRGSRPGQKHRCKSELQLGAHSAVVASGMEGPSPGCAFGDIHWTGKDPKLESSSGEGSLRIHNGRVDDVPLLNKLAELAQKKSFERLDLNECSLSFAWHYPEIEIKDITIEEKGKFRIEGEISIKRRCCEARSDLGLPVNIWIGCRTLKKYLVDVQAGTYGRTCIYPARLMNPGRTSASASSNSSRNRPALISVSCFASSAIG